MNPLNSDSKQNLPPPCQGEKKHTGHLFTRFNKTGPVGDSCHQLILRFGEGLGGPLADAEPTTSPDSMPVA